MASYVETAAEIAREAGVLLQGYFERRVAFELKGEHDLVTEADRASEKLIVERLRAHFPGHSILAEEGGGNTGTSEFQWYVDPLDGTTNFAHGYPIYNVTLALEKAGELIAGVTLDPTRQELFTAEKGSGAFLNGKQIRVSKAKTLEESIAVTGFPSRKRHQNVNVHFFYQLSMMTHGVRRTGSAAVDLAWLACGRSELFWEFQLNPWDMAAGVLLVREAGGTVTDMHGSPFNLRGDNILGDNTLVHEETTTVFGDIFAGKWEHSLPEVHG
jgi:myo-inositol-1(or 4)-monophosphatase